MSLLKRHSLYVLQLPRGALLLKGTAAALDPERIESVRSVAVAGYGGGVCESPPSDVPATLAEPRHALLPCKSCRSHFSSSGWISQSRSTWTPYGGLCPVTSMSTFWS